MKKVLAIMFAFFLAASFGFGLSKTKLYKANFSPTTPGIGSATSGIGANPGFSVDKIDFDAIGTGIDFSGAAGIEFKEMTRQEAEELADEINAAEARFNALKRSNESNFTSIESEINSEAFEAAETKIEESRSNLEEMMSLIGEINRKLRQLERYKTAQEHKAYVELPGYIEVYEYLDESSQESYEALEEELEALQSREDALRELLQTTIDTTWRTAERNLNNIKLGQMQHQIEYGTYSLQLTEIKHDTIKRKSHIVSLLVNWTKVLETYVGNVVERESKLNDYKKETLLTIADNVLQIHIDFEESGMPALVAEAERHMEQADTVVQSIADKIAANEAAQAEVIRQMEHFQENALSEEWAEERAELIEDIQDQIDEALANAAFATRNINSTDVQSMYNTHAEQSTKLNELEYTLAFAKAELEMEEEEYDDDEEDEEDEEDDYEENDDDDEDETDYDEVDLKIHSLSYDEDDHELEIRICADDLNEYTEVRIEWDIENEDYDQTTSLDDSDCPGRGVKLSLDRFDIDEGDYFDVNVKLVALDFDEDNTSNNRDSDQFKRDEDDSHKRDHDDDDDEKEDDEDDRYDYDYDYDDNEVFRDISGHWSEDYVMEAYDRGWVNGTGRGYFEPNRRVNAAEYIKMLAETAEYGSRSGASEFNINIPSWLNGYLVALEKADVIRVRDGLIQDFNEPITRCDAALYIARAYGVTKYLDDGENPFRDVRDSSYCAYAIVALYELDVIDGYSDDTFKPFQYLTRAEALTLLIKARDI